MMSEFTQIFIDLFCLKGGFGRDLFKGVGIKGYDV